MKQTTYLENLATSYQPEHVQKTADIWEKNHDYRSSIDEAKPSYCIQLPPPNVTGTLHMGHGFQHTLMDILTRYHKMKGFNTLWQPGTDHAGIATQMVVERQLQSHNISRHDLGRDQFIEKVWEWKEQSGNVITQQMRRLGTSCDWERERFTMDEGLSKTVSEVFVQLFEQGLIYRGKRLVNWDPKLQTAISDLEVISEEEQGSMWHIRYPFADDSNFTGQYLIVATTRPETLLGDVAVAVNPNDERYQAMIGQFLQLPLTDKKIPIIADDYVDANFGTGCVKITPAHDFNDYEVGKRHGFEPISVMTLQGFMNELCPVKYQGLERFEARKIIVEDLQTLNLLAEIKPHTLKVPRGDRSGVVIEPMLTNQWFVAVNQTWIDKNGVTQLSMGEKALNAVKNNDIAFVPDNWKNTYYQWMNNLQDWCISRQLWWGHQIPAWFDLQGNVYVARTIEEAAIQAQQPIENLTQDADVLDTWFSSALWCFSTLDWSGDDVKDAQNLYLKHFLPSSVLVTGFDIIFFWVARMVMMTLHFTNQIPFKQVCVTGLVRDHEGQKMSKSKGNVLDPIDIIDGISLENLIDKRTTGLMNPQQAQSISEKTKQTYPDGIKSYGVDALRLTFASLANHGRDVKFDLQRCEGYRNFCNKLWNATRFVLMNTENKSNENNNHNNHNNHDVLQQISQHFSSVDLWIESQLLERTKNIEQAFADYRFDIAVKELYEFVWEDYCDWYLELTKVQLQQGTLEQQHATRFQLLRMLEAILRVAHPIMPFITESLWQSVAPVLASYYGENSNILSNATNTINATSNSVLRQNYNTNSNIDAVGSEKELAKTTSAIEFMGEIQTYIETCRQLRSELKINPSQKVDLLIEKPLGVDGMAQPYIQSLAKINRVYTTKEEIPQGFSYTSVGSFVLGQTITLLLEVDVTAEKERLTKELKKLQTTIDGLEKKLGNESYVAKAPAIVVEKDQQQLALARETLQKIQEQLVKLSA